MSIYSKEFHYWKDIQEKIPLAEGIPNDPENPVELCVNRVGEDATYGYYFADSTGFMYVDLNRTHHHRRAEVGDGDCGEAYQNEINPPVAPILLRSVIYQMAAFQAHELYDKCAPSQTVLGLAALLGAHNLQVGDPTDKDDDEVKPLVQLSDHELAQSLAHNLQRHYHRAAHNNFDIRKMDYWSYSLDLTNPEVLDRVITPREPATIYLPDSPVWSEAHFPADWDGSYAAKPAIIA